MAKAERTVALKIPRYSSPPQAQRTQRERREGIRRRFPPTLCEVSAVCGVFAVKDAQVFCKRIFGHLLSNPQSAIRNPQSSPLLLYFDSIIAEQTG